MTNQVQLFNTQNQPLTDPPDWAQPPLALPDDLPPSPRPREFYYGEKSFEDPGPEYSNEKVLEFLSEIYPELTGGTWNTQMLPDGTEKVTFVKVMGEKGCSLLPVLPSS